VSKTFGGNLTGVFFVILGCLAGYGAYRINFPWGMVGGVVVALIGATIISPAAVGQGAKDFQDSAAGFVKLIPGRRGSDTKDVLIAVKPDAKKEGGGD
jgi:hypothetical protein